MGFTTLLASPNKIVSHSLQQVAAATLADILERKAGNGELRIWLTTKGRAALEELGESSQPADPRLALRELAIAVKSAGSPDGYGARMVFAAGSPDADLMLIGNAPSQDDTAAGAPFSGEVGKKLDGILKAMGLHRDQLYLTNIAKFRPLESDDITADEVAAFRRTILSEINAVKPRAIIAFGKTAVQALSNDEATLATHRGRDFAINGIPIVATDHPSQLIAYEADNADTARHAKRAFWEDMLRAMELLDLTISAKQQGFFK